MPLPVMWWWTGGGRYKQVPIGLAKVQVRDNNYIKLHKQILPLAKTIRKCNCQSFASLSSTTTSFVIGLL